jgi:hypothetical protein
LKIQNTSFRAAGFIFKPGFKQQAASALFVKINAFAFRKGVLCLSVASPGRWILSYLSDIQSFT